MSQGEYADHPSTFDIAAAKVDLHEGGLLRIEAKKVAYGLEHAEEIADLCQRLHEERGRKLRLLVDMREMISISREARVRLQAPEHDTHVIATAMLVDSGVSRVIGNFLLGLNRGGALPNRLFTTEAEALAWLESLPDE